MQNEFKPDVDKIMKQITAWGKGTVLKSARPQDGVAAYVWRMIRFHSGKDLHMPISCYFHLFEQLHADSVINKMMLGILDTEHQEIMDILEPIIVECSNRLDLSNFTAARRFQGMLY